MFSVAQYGTTMVIWNVEMVPNIVLVYIYLRYLVGRGGVLKNGCASHCDYDRAKVCCDVNVVLERF